MTAHLVWEQIRRARHLSLAEVFRLEYAMSLNCCRHPEFAGRGAGQADRSGQRPALALAGYRCHT